MNIKLNIVIKLLLLLSLINPLFAQQNWTDKVRIAGNQLPESIINSIIATAKYSYVYGIEVDNDTTGRYESFINPEYKLKEIKNLADASRNIGSKSFVYIAGLECMTLQADNKSHTFYKNHIDCAQKNIKGELAIFGSKNAFWIAEDNGDVWISPYETEWCKILRRRVREIIETGIDGIYLDIPYWMTHFEAWKNTWVSFDNFTVVAFKEKTSLYPNSTILLLHYKTT
ncbi:MAG: hypothetical protein ACUVRG_03750 [Ignavibacterium sp.]|uniref:hypothetical protein n=1 Tax=Ignavibacterium sp. TaxID=2651167 RepID=UPI0040495634